MSSSRIVALIPSRLESSRLPRKALVDICGLPMIVHVFKRCFLSKKLDDVIVATDSEEIARVVESYGGKYAMTSTSHETGSDRIAEVAENLDCEIVVNVQGDEALLDPNHLDKVIEALENDNQLNVAALVYPSNKRNSPSNIKAVLDEDDYIMYSSRADIPSDSRTKDPVMWKVYHIIPFRRDFLLKYCKWTKGKLERIEYNEYLRILEKGYKIKAVRVDSSAISVDTESDLEYVRNVMPNDLYFTKYK